MTDNNFIKFKMKDLKRLYVINKVIDGSIKQAEAAALLSLSTRQIRRIIKRVKLQGDEGIMHKSRGRPSNHKYPEKLKDRVIKLYREKYKGLDPACASWKLSEEDTIRVNRETLRKWLIESGAWGENEKKRSDVTLVITDKISRPKNTVQAGKVIFKDKRDGNSPQKREKPAEKQQDQKHIIAPKKKYIPPPDHPWRKLMYPQYAHKDKH